MPTDVLVRAVRFARSMRPRSSDQPIVLAYHRIARPASDPQLLSVTPEDFAEHLQVIADRYQPMSLAALVAAVAEGRPVARAVAVTFDDGYADNLLAAKPHLERTGVPATVFVASGHVSRERAFWWDELERLLLSPGRLPSTLVLEVGGDALSWELGSDAVYTTADAAERAGWTVLDERAPGPRQQVYRALVGLLRALDGTEREKVLDRIGAVADLERAADGETPRPVTHEELVRLDEGDLMDIGAHTESHPVLSQLDVEQQRKEVIGSKRWLEETLGRAISAFAYPYGTHADFDEATVSVVRDAAFDHACSTIPGRIANRTDPFRIPRLVVRNWSGSELERRLALTR